MSNKFTTKVTSPFLRVVYSCLIVIALALLLLPLIWFAMTMWTMRSYTQLEQNAKQIVTAAELQSWATNFLAQPRPGDLASSANWGTNFPAPLLKLNPKLGPTLAVNTSRNTNEPTHLLLTWGNGFLGRSGFDIGPTNYVNQETNAHSWGPGVYFFKR